ncbi:MAG: HRDC domain-containing protein [Anaerolineaceae bacterium]
MSIIELPKPHLITQVETLNELSEKLKGEKRVAVDTESNSLYAYQEQVCLIQFSITQQDYIVDPLVLIDLSPLAPIFADPNIEKIFHASEYDLICLKRDFGFTFNNIFDTFTAARILGREAVGLGSLLESEFSMTVNKRYQRANWGQRPLPSHLLTYAQIDTHFLIPLRDRLAAELTKKNLLPLAQEDFKRLCQVNNHNGDEKSNDCWRINGANDLSPQKAAVLQELCRLRDRIAKRINQPLFKVFNDRVLIELAIECPRTIEEMVGLELLNSRQIKQDGEAIIAAINKGLAASPIYPNRSHRPSDEFLSRLENLRKWRKNTAMKMQVSSDVVLPRDLLFQIAELDPVDMKELQDIMKNVPWRLQQFGDQIIHAIHE